MYSSRTKFILSLLFLVISYACTTNQPAEKEVSDPLPLWNEGNTKSAIIDFVENVTNTASADFIEVSDRIATFDNNGNLWSEQPAYFQLFFAIDRVKQMASEHPEWKNHLSV